MSAETLRRAADEMRRWAGQATPGRWKLWGMTVMADQDGTSNYATAVGVAQTHYRDEHNKPRTFDAEHIRGMQPAVALAVADWLDCVAAPFDQVWEPDEDGTLWGYDLDGDRLRFDESQDSLALAVARAYLGGDS